MYYYTIKTFFFRGSIIHSVRTSLKYDNTETYNKFQWDIFAPKFHKKQRNWFKQFLLKPQRCPTWKVRSDFFPEDLFWNLTNLYSRFYRCWFRGGHGEAKVCLFNTKISLMKVFFLYFCTGTEEQLECFLSLQNLRRFLLENFPKFEQVPCENTSSCKP